MPLDLDHIQSNRDKIVDQNPVDVEIAGKPVTARKTLADTHTSEMLDAGYEPGTDIMLFSSRSEIEPKDVSHRDKVVFKSGRLSGQEYLVMGEVRRSDVGTVFHLREIHAA